jgi:hypothetical protein
MGVSCVLCGMRVNGGQNWVRHRKRRKWRQPRAVGEGDKRRLADRGG